jgi:hypothetical protein
LRLAPIIGGVASTRALNASLVILMGIFHAT